MDWIVQVKLCALNLKSFGCVKSFCWHDRSRGSGGFCFRKRASKSLMPRSIFSSSGFSGTIAGCSGGLNQPLLFPDLLISAISLSKFVFSAPQSLQKRSAGDTLAEQVELEHAVFFGLTVSRRLKAAGTTKSTYCTMCNNGITKEILKPSI